MTEEKINDNSDQYSCERRRFLRINANFVVSYYVFPGHVNKTDMSLTRNVCIGGICFTTDKHFPPGIILHITLRLPKVEKLIVVLGEVVYVRQEKNKKFLFDLGVKFIEASDDDLLIIERVIKECASKDTKIYFNIEEMKEKYENN